MYITSSVFIKSSILLEECPPSNWQEFAFIGRSNVGKSSLINMLTNKKKLALTSSTPGKTKVINHFLINNSWYLVDLPGYGYIKQAKEFRFQLSVMVKNYFLKRTNLTCTFVLIDLRHSPQQNDLNFMQWLGINNIPFWIVFTKADKVKSKNISTLLNNYKIEMLKYWEIMPSYFITSVKKKYGKDEILKKINSLINKDS